MQGMPIGADREFAGMLLDLLRPYPLLIGVFAVATFAMHGSIYLYLKTEGDLQRRIHGWMWWTFGIFLVLCMISTVVTLATQLVAIRNFQQMPWAWGVVLLSILAIANIPRALHQNRSF